MKKQWMYLSVHFSLCHGQEHTLAVVHMFQFWEEEKHQADLIIENSVYTFLTFRQIDLSFRWSVL